MNCSEGNLAIVTRGKRSGMVVRCLIQSVTDGIWVVSLLRRDAMAANDRATCPDSMLRPLNDTEGIDETLIWAGLPKGRVKK